MHPAIKQDVTTLSGYEQFQLAMKNLLDADSIHEINVATAFESLNELQQQTWLKAAGCRLFQVRKWSQLNKRQRNRMMSELKAICAIARAYQ